MGIEAIKSKMIKTVDGILHTPLEMTKKPHTLVERILFNTGLKEEEYKEISKFQNVTYKIKFLTLLIKSKRETVLQYNHFISNTNLKIALSINNDMSSFGVRSNLYEYLEFTEKIELISKQIFSLEKARQLLFLEQLNYKAERKERELFLKVEDREDFVVLEFLLKKYKEKGFQEINKYIKLLTPRLAKEFLEYMGYVVNYDDMDYTTLTHINKPFLNDTGELLEKLKEEDKDGVFKKEADILRPFLGKETYLYINQMKEEGQTVVLDDEDIEKIIELVIKTLQHKKARASICHNLNPDFISEEEIPKIKGDSNMPIMMKSDAESLRHITIQLISTCNHFALTEKNMGVKNNSSENEKALIGGEILGIIKSLETRLTEKDENGELVGIWFHGRDGELFYKLCEALYPNARIKHIPLSRNVLINADKNEESKKQFLEYLEKEGINKYKYSFDTGLKGTLESWLNKHFEKRDMETVVLLSCRNPNCSQLLKTDGKRYNLYFWKIIESLPNFSGRSIAYDESFYQLPNNVFDAALFKGLLYTILKYGS